jgi:predicted amidohydrolase
MSRVPVAIAQTNPLLGDLAKNLAHCASLAERAAAGGARLLLFPELAATGYFLKDIVPDVALRPDDPRLKDLLDLSKRIAIVIGLVEGSPDFVYYNSALYLDGGSVLAAHRKVYLPTYGVFDEARYLAAGGAFRAFDAGLGRVAMLVCEDAWHLSAPYIVVQDGAQVLLVLSVSPVRGLVAEVGPGAAPAAAARAPASSEARPASAEAWEAMNRTYARLLGVYVLYANRVGFEDGVSFWGGSEIVAPDGSTVAKAPYFEEALVFGEVDLRAVRRARLATPLFRDERLGLTVRELGRILGESERRQ